jgi:hypothetical protein
MALESPVLRCTRSDTSGLKLPKQAPEINFAAFSSAGYHGLGPEYDGEKTPLWSIGRPATTRFFGKSVKTPNMNSKRTIPTTLLIGIVGVVVVVFAVSPRLRDPVLKKGRELVARLRGKSSASDQAGSGGVSPPSGAASNRESVAAGPPEAGNVAVRPQTPAQQVLRRAIERLESRGTITTTTRQTVDLFGKQLSGVGEYLEQRTDKGLKYRLELRTQLGDQTSTLIQVSDGRYLWRAESCGGTGTAERVDLGRLERAREEQAGSTQPGKMGIWPGLGGLSKLFESLDRRFEFTNTDPTTIRDHDREIPVIRLRGDWKGDRAAIGDGRKRHLPHYVVLFLDKEDLFPYRIEFRRRDPKPSLVLKEPEDQMIARMEFFVVTFDGPVDPDRFRYNPGKLVMSEQTERVLTQLGLKKP